MMKKLTIAIPLFLAFALVACGLYVLSRPDQRFVVAGELDLSQALSNPASPQFAKVFQPRDFHFPRDHGPHPEYGVEWWYYTGNLDSEAGRHFGFELTLFRIGLAPRGPDRPSHWGASQLYMGHFAVTDVDSHRFYSFQRFSREALGLAGASLADNQRFRVWLEDWSVEGQGAERPTIRLKAAQENIAIDLTLVSGKPVVLQGDQGFSRKSAAPGNASYYYSITRLPTSGTIVIGEQSFLVKGNSWMDREWSTTALAAHQVGWDWFALQLSDRRDLMYYQIRLRDGSVDPVSSGAVVSENGSTVPIKVNDVNIQVLDRWDSPRGGSYPARWRLQVPSQGIDVVVTPYARDQELDLSVRYWEGAVMIEGTSRGRPVSGNGYVEMTGYAASPGGRSSSPSG